MLSKSEKGLSNNKYLKKNLIVVFCGVILILIICTIIFLELNNDKPLGTGGGNNMNEEVLNLNDISWEQYQMLSLEEKMLLPDKFENMEEYNEWYERIKPSDEIVLPTVDLKGKNAEDFSWEEYQLLTPEEKMVFPDYFESFDAYKVWYDSVCQTEE